VTGARYSPPLDEVTTALLTLLNDSGRKVWDGVYGGDPLDPVYPYGILYRIPGGNADATPDMSGQPTTVTGVWQVTTVAGYRNVCERAARDFHDRIVARTSGGFVYPLPISDGWECTDRRPDPAVPGIDRGGEHPRAVFSLPARYLITIGPA
jgi:hypothetical protein